MRQNPCELARNSSVHELHDIEVRGEQDVEIALVYLRLVSSVPAKKGDESLPKE